MTGQQIFWISLIICFIGVASIIGIVWFGKYLFEKSILRYFPDSFKQWDFVIHWMEKSGNRRDAFDLFKTTSETYIDFIQRRNEFWTTYGQVVITVLIIIVISILLLTKTISAEAGLPILSGISGFAIAKGVSGTRTAISPPDRPQG